MIDDATFGNAKALYKTFGCRLNFAETSTVARQFAERGIRRVSVGETPDFIVVNTCSVTEVADKKCRQAIRSLAKKYPDAKILVTGCYAQLKADEVAGLPGVVVVAGIDQKHNLSRFLDDWAASREQQRVVNQWRDIRAFTPSCARGDRTRYFLKVQDGCDYFCSYCTIPLARGRSRSGSIANIIAQAEAVAAEGGKEIVITGVNIGDFGKGTDESFFDLIRRLDEVDGIERYRISSIEPNLLTDEIIDWVSSSRRFMPYFHIPLQSGDDDVLRLMRRHYDTSLFRHCIERIRSVMPDAFIGVDLIVGMRGETDERFSHSCQFIESIDISRLHVFTYSERPGTNALRIDHVVSQEEKHCRTRQVLALSERKLADFSRRFLNTVRPVLLEHTRRGRPMAGFTDNYLKVEVPSAPALDNHIVNVRLDSLAPDGEKIFGTLLL